MKAIVYTKYGPPEVLQLKEVEKPVPKDNEVLVKVHAVGVNASDWEGLRGKPLYARVMGLFKPGKKILGSDIAGRVEAVGKNVKQFKPGDEVFGDILGHMGGFAQYVCAPENTLLQKPAGMTFEEAAALPQSAVIALQGIRDKGQVQPGNRVLINGASGGIGTFAVQIAKHFGAEVTGVCSTRNLDMVRSLGADHVIDYTREDFTQNGQRYDLILDIKAFRSISDYEHALSPQGMYVLAGGSVTRILQTAIAGKDRMVNYQVRPSQEDLVFMKELIEAGKLVPVIDKRYKLSEVPEALRHFTEGRHSGKIVVAMET
jgi:NADPH:quinone reductase-like Zn-dependent oxidoreductase